MLHDSLTVEEVVDSESALEFMKEATKLATSSDLEDLSERIARKAEFFGRMLETIWEEMWMKPEEEKTRTYGRRKEHIPSSSLPYNSSLLSKETWRIFEEHLRGHLED